MGYFCFHVIPGWPEGPDLRCAIAHRGISMNWNDTARDSGFAPLARPGMTVRALRKRLDAGDGAAEDQGVDVVGTFIGIHGFQVRGVPHHVIFDLDPVAAMHVA